MLYARVCVCVYIYIRSTDINYVLKLFPTLMFTFILLLSYADMATLSALGSGSRWELFGEACSEPAAWNTAFGRYPMLQSTLFDISPKEPLCSYTSRYPQVPIAMYTQQYSEAPYCTVVDSKQVGALL